MGDSYEVGIMLFVGISLVNLYRNAFGAFWSIPITLILAFIWESSILLSGDILLPSTYVLAVRTCLKDGVEVGCKPLTRSTLA
jgi:hypothetical protein